MVLRATGVLPAACWRWAELLTWHGELQPWLDTQSPGCCKIPPPRHIPGSAGYQRQGTGPGAPGVTPVPWGPGWLVLGSALPPEPLACPGPVQPGLSGLGPVGALHAPAVLRGVDVLTQCGLLQSRQALTKNTFPVQRELPCHTLLFCFPLRAFLLRALPWSPSRVLPLSHPSRPIV